ncbi:YciI family protein [Shouchella shacheensis]|uniref:YciI family protein n=1 Tax=Shouchella shacheensis TaxID=1649580 RepID=UPI00073FEEAB|nr:YciI family protein [Shouchella shacheensis]
MNYYAVLLPMRDKEKSRQFREEHLLFLEKGRREGWIFANGRFTDQSGGLVIYKARELQEVEGYVQQDPYIIHGARNYEIHEWEMVLGE